MDRLTQESLEKLIASIEDESHLRKVQVEIISPRELQRRKAGLEPIPGIFTYRTLDKEES